MDAYALAIIISVLVYVAIGNYAGRKVKHLDDYFVAGRRAPTFMILGTLVASVVGTNSFLCDVGMGYNGYAAALIISVPMTGKETVVLLDPTEKTADIIPIFK